MSKSSLLAVLIGVACTSQTTSHRELVETSHVDTPSSTATKVIEEPARNPLSFDTTNLALDSSLYIGEISMFPETDELYTSVYYHKDLATEGLFDYLHQQTDSVIYEDAEIQRTRVPTSIAREYFNLSGLDTISVYQNAQHVGNARLVRIEYMEDLIEGGFIAVFEPVGLMKLSEEVDYCVSRAEHQYKTINIKYEDITDEQLTSKLLQRFVQDTVQVWRVLHTRVLPYEVIYSAISMHSRLLLIETNGSESRILMDFKEDWFISDITPLHVQRNGKPMLLLKMGVNETDMMWDAVAAFNGDGYVFGEGNRF